MPRPQRIERTSPPFLGPIKAGYKPRIEDNCKPAILAELIRPPGARAHLDTPEAIEEAARKTRGRGAIADAVAQARAARDMTQQEFADLVGVGIRMISALECGYVGGYRAGTASRKVLDFLGIAAPTGRGRG